MTTPDQVVGGHREGEPPADTVEAAVPRNSAAFEDAVDPEAIQASLLLISFSDISRFDILFAFGAGSAEDEPSVGVTSRTHGG